MGKKQTKADPRGRPKLELSAADMKMATTLASKGCTQAEIADTLSISLATFERRVSENPAFFEGLRAARMKANEAVMTSAYKMATSAKNDRMTIFWLRCRMGWVEARNEEEKVPTKPLKLNYTRTSKKEAG